MIDLQCFERGDHEIKDLCFEKHQGLQPSPVKGCCHEEEEQSHLHAHVAGTCRNSQEKVVLKRVSAPPSPTHRVPVVSVSMPAP